MDKHDELTRLAERVEAFRIGEFYEERDAIAAELRTLAQQGKAGGVPDGWAWVPRVLPIEMDIAFCEAWFSRRRPIDDSEMQDAWDAALEVAPQPPPAAQHDRARETSRRQAAVELLLRQGWTWNGDAWAQHAGPAVDDAMVERAVEAFLANTGQHHAVTTLQRELTTTCMHAALTAALSPQPKDAT